MIDPFLFYHYHHGQLALICVYVNDIIICSSDMQYMAVIKSRFQARYDIIIVGRLTSFLNIRVTWKETGLRLDQQQYAEKVQRKHMGQVPRKKHCPAMLRDNLSEQTDFVRTCPYRELVGETLYLAMRKRLNVACAVEVLSRQCKSGSM